MVALKLSFSLKSLKTQSLYARWVSQCLFEKALNDRFFIVIYLVYR